MRQKPALEEPSSCTEEKLLYHERRLWSISTTLVLLLCSSVVASCYQVDPNNARVKNSFHRRPVAPKELVTTLPVSHEYCRAKIDFSSANEYIDDQYGHVIPQPYFSVPKQYNVPIYDARKGVYEARTGTFVPASLQAHGFETITSDHLSQTGVADWRDLDQIRGSYLPRLRDLISARVKRGISNAKVLDIIFWHPVLRGQQFACAQRFDKEQAKTANMAVADVAHVDIDFGAYEDDCDGIAKLVFGSHLREADRTALTLEELQALLSPCDTVGKATGSRRRFAIINAWRNVLPQPIQCAPLALLHTQYPAAAQSHQQHVGFPDAVPCPQQSKWYTFSELSQDELLLFYQYDRNLAVGSDVWHQALPEIGNPEVTSRRKSFDVRMLVILDEDVPIELDRLRPDRTRAKGEDA